MLKEEFDNLAGAALVVNVADSDVVIAADNHRTIRVEVTIKARSESLAQEILDAHNFDVAVRENTVRISTDRDRTYRMPNNSSTRVRISTPHDVDLDVRTADGDVKLDGTDGKTRLRTADGDIVAGKISGPSLTAITADGDISIDTATFDELSARTADGDIVVMDAIANTVTANAADGDIHFGTLEGAVDMQTADGDIYIESLQGPASILRTADGDIMLEQSRGDLEAFTTDGDISVSLDQPGDVALRTVDGDVVVTVPNQMAADLSLIGSSVRLDCCRAFTGETSKKRAEGQLNGGGHSLNVRTLDGDILLRER